MIQPLSGNPKVGRLTFISDLHLFSNRCNASEHHDLIERSIQQSDLCIWGGDLFDFRGKSPWKTQSSHRGKLTRSNRATNAIPSGILRSPDWNCASPLLGRKVGACDIASAASGGA